MSGESPMSAGSAANANDERVPTIQEVLAKLIEIERLQSRVCALILNIQDLMDDVPPINQPVRQSVILAMQQLGDANRELESQKLYYYLNIIADLQHALQTANRLPTVHQTEDEPGF
eukprot:s726_g13.t1